MKSKIIPIMPIFHSLFSWFGQSSDSLGQIQTYHIMLCITSRLTRHRFKDIVKDILKRAEVLDSWTESVDNRPEWRKLTFKVCDGID